MKDEHPHLLLWYASGVIGFEERAEIEEHLERCDGCRQEASALRSMMKSLKAQCQIDHVTPADLVLYEDDALPSHKGRRAAIEDHLRDCDPCNEDLQALGRAGRLERTATRDHRQGRSAPARRRRIVSRRVWALAGISIAAAILIGVSLRTLSGPLLLDTDSQGVKPVYFSAPVRGEQAARTLTGEGPWPMRVALPFGAREGRYRVTIRRESGATVPDSETAASTDDELCLSLLLPALPGHGKYEMLLQSETERAEPPQVYPFEVVSPAGRMTAH